MTKSESSSSQSSPKMLRMMSVMLAKKPSLSLSLLVRGGGIVKRRSLSWLNAWLASLKMVMV